MEGDRNRNGAEPVYGPAYTAPAHDKAKVNASAGRSVENNLDGPSPPYMAPYPPYPSDVPDTLPIPVNVTAALAYLIVPAVVFLLVPPYRSQPILRFHSWQAIFYFLVGVAVREVELVVASMLPSAVAFLLSGLLMLLLFTGWIVVVIKALQGERLLLPVVGHLAEHTGRSTSLHP